MYFSTKSYLKSNRNHTAKHTLRGSSMEIKKERETKGRKKTVDTKSKVCWPHVLPNDRGVAEMIRTPP